MLKSQQCNRTCFRLEDSCRFCGSLCCVLSLSLLVDKRWAGWISWVLRAWVVMHVGFKCAIKWGTCHRNVLHYKTLEHFLAYLDGALNLMCDRKLADFQPCWRLGGCSQKVSLAWDFKALDELPSTGRQRLWLSPHQGFKLCGKKHQPGAGEQRLPCARAPVPSQSCLTWGLKSLAGILCSHWPGACVPLLRWHFKPCAGQLCPGCSEKGS